MRTFTQKLSCALAVILLAGCSSTSTGTASSQKTLEGSAEGFGGEVKVILTMNGEKITKCEIIGDQETETVGQAAFEELSNQVIAADGAEIDGVTGATYTSKAVIEAVTEALSNQ